MECTSEGVASIFLAILLFLSEGLPYVSKLFGKDLTKYNGVLHTITALISDKCVVNNENIASATPTPGTVEIDINNLKNKSIQSRGSDTILSGGAGAESVASSVNELIVKVKKETEVIENSISDIKEV